MTRTTNIFANILEAREALLEAEGSESENAAKTSSAATTLLIYVNLIEGQLKEISSLANESSNNNDKISWDAVHLHIDIINEATTKIKTLGSGSNIPTDIFSGMPGVTVIEGGL